MSFRMRCIVCSIMSSILMTLMIGLVVAQDVPPVAEPSPAAPAPKKKIVYREKSYFEFEDTLINGNLRAPDGSFIFRKSQSSFSSALNLRRSFIPELKASSNDAR